MMAHPRVVVAVYIEAHTEAMEACHKGMGAQPTVKQFRLSLETEGSPGARVFFLDL